MTAQTIGDCILDPWPGGSGRPAVVIDRDRFDFDRVQRESLAYADALLGLGLQVGDRVGILMPNGLEWIEAFLAVALVGGVSVPLNTRFELDELRYIAAHAELVAVITTAEPAGQTDFVSLVRRSLPEAWGQAPPDGYEPLPIQNVLIEGSTDSDTINPAGFRIERAVPPDRVMTRAASVGPRDIATVLYTSGTTSRPKGCLMSHEALVRTGSARFDERRWDSSPLTIWTPCPLFHVGALVPLLGALATGSTYVTSRYFDPAQALALLERERVTTALPLFSAFTDALLDCPRLDEIDLSSLRDILTTGPRPGVERAQQAFAPARIVAGYGMTELCGVAASSPIDESDPDRLIWSGRPFSGIEMAVVDHESHRALPPGTMGEIVARGYCALSGYLKDDKATAAAFDDDGWFHTGDMGVLSEDGRVAFKGRFKDLLKVGGENVAASEVEEYLARHPAVRRAEVVGAPDDRLNEVVAAFIELQPGAMATPEDIVDFCRGRIARFKVPRLVRFVPPGAWPMSATKVDKVALRQWIER